MNTSQDQINQIQSLLDQAQEVVVATPKDPSFDTIAASLAFYLTLSARGKRVSVVCPDQITVEFSHLVGADKVTHAINGASGRNLIISFPYQEGSIEKVSYNIENGKFNLVIEPRENFPRVTPEMMNYSYSGGKTDFIVTVSTPQLTDLGTLYSQNESLFTDAAILNIDTSAQNQNYGKVNIIDPSLSSVSQLVAGIISQLGLPIDPDSATNLFAGITSASHNFSTNLTQASTFETAALLLRNGAKTISVPQENIPSPTFSRPMVKPGGFQKPIISPTTKPPFQSRGFAPHPRQNQPVPQQSQQQIMSPQSHISQKQSSETPPDWLKPKIYKSSTLL